MFNIRQKVRVKEEYQEHYGMTDRDYLYVTHISTNTDDHPGYDASMEGMALYDLEETNGDSFPNSLYEYELEPVEMNHYETRMMEERLQVLPAVSDPGSYPIVYIDDQGCALCADCATKFVDSIIDHQCYMEGATMECDASCGNFIESAYGDPDAEDEEDEDFDEDLERTKQIEAGQVNPYPPEDYEDNVFIDYDVDDDEEDEIDLEEPEEQCICGHVDCSVHGTGMFKKDALSTMERDIRNSHYED